VVAVVLGLMGLLWGTRVGELRMTRMRTRKRKRGRKMTVMTMNECILMGAMMEFRVRGSSRPLQRHLLSFRDVNRFILVKSKQDRQEEA
jgi:hypothetical protein